MYMHIDDKPSLGSLGISRLNGRALCEVREATVNCPLQKHFPLFLSCNYARGSVAAAATSTQLSPRSLRKLQTSQALGSRKTAGRILLLGERRRRKDGGEGGRIGQTLWFFVLLEYCCTTILKIHSWSSSVDPVVSMSSRPAISQRGRDSLVESQAWALRLLVPEPPGTFGQTSTCDGSLL